MFISKKLMGFTGSGFLLLMLLNSLSSATIHDVSIVDFQFAPEAQTVSVGDTVRWTNNGSFPHTSTSDHLVWDSGQLTHGQSFSFHFTSAGSFPYHCNFHPSMTATIVVQTTDVKDETGKSGKPSEFILHQNYPNPFNQSTNIEFSLVRSGFVSLIIYDLQGRKVKILVAEDLSSGHKSVVWDVKDNTGNEVASGVYFYRLRAGDFCEAKKLVLLK
jgi:plastocyanin